jgi:subtilase family serine protease
VSADATSSPAKPPAADRPLSCGPPTFFIPCYTPKQFEVAYGVQPLLSRGINGRGETVVMPEVLNAPGPNFTDIRKDLAAFDSRFGLPPARLRVTTLAPTMHPYVAGTEEVEDTEVVHVGYQAGPGWDPVTGWGSPDAQVLIPLLAHEGDR